MGKRELVALLNLSSWCLLMVERLFLAVPWGCLRFVIVVFPDHNHLQFNKLSCTKDFQNLNSMVTWYMNERRLLPLIIFQRSSLKLLPIIKNLAIT